MKNIVIILIALATLQLTAQDEKKALSNEAQKERKEAMKDLTPEEMATLRTKKMTLHLDLDEAQQKQIQAMNLEEAKLRKAKMEERSALKAKAEAKTFTKEDKLKMMNEHLDHQIEVKKKMKGILNAEQYEKWEASQGKAEHRREAKKKMMKHKMEKEKQ